MKMLLITILSCIIGGAVFAGNPGENLLKNPGFEEGLKNWGSWTPGAKMELLSDDVKSGKGALRFRYEEQKKQAIFVQGFNVNPNTNYIASCMIKGSAERIELKLFYYNKKDEYIGEATLFSGAVLPDWFKVEKTFTPKDNTVRVAIGLLIVNGYVQADDFEVFAGKKEQIAQNELFNSSFQYSNRDDKMPDFWNTGGDFSIATFQPGFAEGKFFRKASEVKSPVPGTDVLYYNQVGGTLVLPMQLAGNEYYTFSLYVKAEKPNSSMTLQLRGMKPESKSFTIGTSWERISLTSFLEKTTNAQSARINFDRNAFYIAAPMIEAGKTVTNWRPNPKDATFPYVMKGQKNIPQTNVISTNCPSAENFSKAETFDVFYENQFGQPVKGKFKAAFYVKDNIFHVSFDLATGKKKNAAKVDGMPQKPGNEMVEIFISPKENGTPYWHFMGGRNGDYVAYQGLGAVKMPGTWNYHAKETASGWHAEFSIPLSIIPESGEKNWRVSLCTTEYVNAKPFYYSASGMKGFHNPAGFMRVSGLPVSGKIMIPPMRAAVEYDLYMNEKTANLKIVDAKFPVVLTVSDFNGKNVYTKELKKSKAVIPVSKLENGYYTVTVKSGKDTASTYFRKLPYQKNAARIDRFKQMIQVNEKPFFPTIYCWSGFGLPDRVPTQWHINELKKRNFNTILLMPETFVEWIAGNSPDLRKNIVKAFHKAGFKIIVWGDAREFKGMDSMVNVRKQQMTELADCDDAIIGWYFVDEVQTFWEKLYHITDTDFAKGYRKLKDFSPYNLHFINWNDTTINDGRKWYGGDGSTDLYSVDIYKYSGSINFGALEGYEYSAGIVSRRGKTDFLPAIVWLQTYSHNEGLREPHQDEYRNNVFVSLINNQVGFMNFAGRPESNDLWDGMGDAYGTALKWLAMTAAEGSECIKTGKNGYISYALWKNGNGGYALIAANTSYAKQSASLVFDVKFGNKLLPFGGKGTLDVEGGKLNITLPIAGSAAWFIK